MDQRRRPPFWAVCVGSRATLRDTMGNQDERQRADKQSGWVAEKVLTVRPALSGRLLMSALAILPIVSIVVNPDLAIVDVGVAVIIAFLAIALWRLHIYPNTDVVSCRGGLNTQ